jgi:SIR2-like domain
LADELPLIPDVPDGIRDAATRGILVPFIGAGVSLLAGCPGWDQLAKGALRTFVAQGKFSHAQLAQIDHLSPRVKLSIALGMQAGTRLPIAFGKLLTPSGGYENAMGRRVYGVLSKLAKTFCTTNYDEWLDSEVLLAEADPLKPDKSAATTPKSLARKMFHEIKDFTPGNLNAPGVFHIHGSIQRPEGMILTTSQYLRHYAKIIIRRNPRTKIASSHSWNTCSRTRQSCLWAMVWKNSKS